MKFLTYKEVQEKTTFSPNTIRALVDAGKFPNPVRPTQYLNSSYEYGNKVLWLDLTIEKWMVELDRKAQGKK